MAAISNDWLEPLSPEFRKPYYARLYRTVKEAYNTREVFPPADELFNAFALTPLASVKAVILGQDPYHNNGQAHGLCFSVKPEVEIPPSLKNIYRELADDVGCYIPNHGCLTKWAEEGVLLLNTVLTVQAHRAYSHRGIGWEEFTDAAIRILNEQDRPIVFLLWGRPAQAKERMLNNPRHLVLKAAHPSPLSASSGFFGCRHFSKTNEFLEAHGVEPIDWQIENIENIRRGERT
ncbi:MAG: uracil-DNA glycosylase [Lachnospiraceae bacterium]|nr:uracil-DNA glycosylase [Lachnospiraceae bacterium]